MTVSPDHYSPKGVIKEQPIETMYHMLTYDGFKAFCLANVVKYVSRFENKGGEEDLNKAETYIEFIRCAYRGESPLYAVNKK